MVADQAARGSDDEYCSAYPSDGHAYSSHSVDAPPIRWVERCHLCGHISSKALREQLQRTVQVRLVTKPEDASRWAAVLRRLPRRRPR